LLECNHWDHGAGENNEHCGTQQERLTTLQQPRRARAPTGATQPEDLIVVVAIQEEAYDRDRRIRVELRLREGLRNDVFRPKHDRRRILFGFFRWRFVLVSRTSPGRERRWRDAASRKRTQLTDELRRIAPSLLTFLAQQPLNRVLEIERNIPPELADRWQLLVLLVVDDRIQIVARPRLLTGEHLVRHHAETVEVAATVQVQTVDLFRRHVRRRAKRSTCNRQRCV